MALLQGLRIRQIACGFDHTLALAEDGSLFSFGSNDLGQLGRPSPGGPAGEALAPQDAAAWLVNPVADCGREAMRFRRVRLVGGSGLERGLAGARALRRAGGLPWHSCTASAGTKPPRPSTLHPAPRPAIAAQVAAGLGHCLGVLEDGNLVSWGWHAGGQCGLGQFITGVRCGGLEGGICCGRSRCRTQGCSLVPYRMRTHNCPTHLPADECIPRPSPVFGVPENRCAACRGGGCTTALAAALHGCPAGRRVAR